MIDPRLVILAAGCAVFGGLIVHELYWETPAAAPATPVAAPVNAAGATSRVHPADTDDLIATALARPLFSSTRRPSLTAQGEAAGGPDLSDKRLAGIVIEPDRRIAIFAVTGAKPLTVAEGDTVNGWRIDSITPTEISLSGTSGTRTLQPTWDPAAATQPRTPRPATRPPPVGTPPAPPGAQAQGAAVQPPGVPARPPVPAGRPPNVAQPGRFPPGVPPNGIIRPGPRP